MSLFLGLLTVALAAGAAPQSGTAWLLVVCGVGGDAEHRETFDTRAQTLLRAATDEHGVPSTNLVYLAERPDEVAGATARADAAGIAAAFERIAAGSARGDLVLVVLIGHGSGQGEGGRFNIAGPDIGPAEFDSHLQQLSGRRVGFVNTSSASAGFLQLAAADRVVITATANLREREEPRFGEFFVAAFADGAADLDKDGRVSLAEAFEYASREVARFYETAGRLQPEHAMLVDLPDPELASASLEKDGVGALARQFVLGGTAVAVAPGEAADPELAALLETRAQLQESLDALRAIKDTLDEDAYLSRLEDLLVEIAAADASIRARGGSQ